MKDVRRKLRALRAALEHSTRFHWVSWRLPWRGIGTGESSGWHLSIFSRRQSAWARLKRLFRADSRHGECPCQGKVNKPLTAAHCVSLWPWPPCPALSRRLQTPQLLYSVYYHTQSEKNEHVWKLIAKPDCLVATFRCWNYKHLISANFRPVMQLLLPGPHFQNVILFPNVKISC